jgi:NAD(P)-dependent dehydrogenase (short-subunit alcohol dehydrogenase family)
MNKLSLDIQGRTAIVTGGFSGLGLHFAHVLAQHGAQVAVAGRRIELGHEVARSACEAIERPGAVRAYAMDVTVARSVQDAFGQVENDMGVPTIVVNNAGKSVRGPTEALTEEEWLGGVDLNLSGVFRVAQAAARAMLRLGVPGTIINIASVLGLRVLPRLAAYTTTKAAVIQLTKALALEWAPHGIRVNALAPGYFVSDLTRNFLGSPEGQALVERIPQKRIGRLEDLDGPLMLLASDASAYMTGEVVRVDGGIVINAV